MKTFLAFTTGLFGGTFVGMVYMATLAANRERREYNEAMMPTIHYGLKDKEL